MPWHNALPTYISTWIPSTCLHAMQNWRIAYPKNEVNDVSHQAVTINGAVIPTLECRCLKKMLSTCHQWCRAYKSWRMEEISIHNYPLSIHIYWLSTISIRLLNWQFPKISIPQMVPFTSMSLCCNFRQIIPEDIQGNHVRKRIVSSVKSASGSPYPLGDGNVSRLMLVMFMMLVVGQHGCHQDRSESNVRVPRSAWNWVSPSRQEKRSAEHHQAPSLSMMCQRLKRKNL